MPAAVKTAHDEHDWAKAKDIVDKEYGHGEGESYYRKVMGIYMKMHGRKPGHTSVTRKGKLWLKTLSKSMSDCNMCGGTGILRVAFKSSGHEEKSLRICPLCKPF